MEAISTVLHNRYQGGGIYEDSHHSGGTDAVLCSRSVEENIAKADKMVREAAANGAQIILLPELFERQYFCQERNYDYYAFATPVDENPAVKHFQKLAAEL